MEIAVLYCADANFLKHLGVSIASLLYSNTLNTFHIFVVSATDLDSEEIEKIRRFVISKNSSFQAAVYDKAINYQYLPAHSHLTFSAYLRLFMTEYLDRTLTKVLYLDGDVLVCEDLGELWEIDIGDAYIGAAPEPYDRIQRAPFGFEPAHLYINSGVMLVNLARWRTDNVLPKFLEFATEHLGLMTYSLDQDIINSVFRGRIYNIGYQWNWQALFPRLTAGELGMSRVEYSQLRRSPKIVHYTSRYKPWFYRWEPHYKRLYRKVLKRSPWADYVPPDKQVRNYPTRLLKILQQQLEWNIPSLARHLRALRTDSGRT